LGKKHPQQRPIMRTTTTTTTPTTAIRPRVNLKELLERKKLGVLYCILAEKYGNDDDKMLEIPGHEVEQVLVDFGLNQKKSGILKQSFEEQKTSLEIFFDQQMAYVAKCGIGKTHIHAASAKIVNAIDEKKDPEMGFLGVTLAIDNADIKPEALKNLSSDWKEPGLSSKKGDAFLYPSTKTKSCPSIIPTHITFDHPKSNTGHQNLLDHFGLPSKYCVGYAITKKDGHNVVKLNSGTCNCDKGPFAKKHIKRGLEGQIGMNVTALLQTNPITRRFLSPMSLEDIKRDVTVIATIPPVSLVSVMRAINPSIDNDLTASVKTRNPVPNASNYAGYPGDDEDSDDEKDVGVGSWSFRRSNGEFKTMKQSAEVEAAFTAGLPSFTYLNNGMMYEVDFAAMKEKSLNDGYTRDVKREIPGGFECLICKKSFPESKKRLLLGCSKELCSPCFLAHIKKSIGLKMEEFGFEMFR